jgi:hypothetical protein
MDPLTGGPGRDAKFPSPGVFDSARAIAPNRLGYVIDGGVHCGRFMRSRSEGKGSVRRMQ